jgi:hypothetical protein
MNNNHPILLLARCLLLGLAVLSSGCHEGKKAPLKDVSDQTQYLNGLKTHADYTLQETVFYRVYENKASLQPANSLWCNFTIDEYTSGRVANQYVKGIIPKGTRLRFEHAFVEDLTTHTIILYYAVVLDGDHRGEEVLINSLTDNLSTWLREENYKGKSELREDEGGGRCLKKEVPQ